MVVVAVVVAVNDVLRLRRGMNDGLLTSRRGGGYCPAHCSEGGER